MYVAMVYVYIKHLQVCAYIHYMRRVLNIDHVDVFMQNNNVNYIYKAVMERVAFPLAEFRNRNVRIFLEYYAGQNRIGKGI